MARPYPSRGLRQNDATVMLRHESMKRVPIRFDFKDTPIILSSFTSFTNQIFRKLSRFLSTVHAPILVHESRYTKRLSQDQIHGSPVR